MSTELQSIGPGWTRTIDGAYQPPVVLSEIEQRRQALAERERITNEDRYRVLAFAYAERDLSDEEIVEVADLAAKLGLSASAPDEHRRAIQQAARYQKIADEPQDFSALEAKLDETRSTAHAELLAIGGRLFDHGPEWLEQSAREIEDAASHLGRDPRNPLPSARWPKTKEVLKLFLEAKSELEYAKGRGPDALATVSHTKRMHTILWPE